MCLNIAIPRIDAKLLTGLYTDLQELEGGAQRSLVVRSLIRLSTESE